MTDSISAIRRDIDAAREASRRAGVEHPRVVLVPTMGALHEGHLALVRRAQELGEVVVVSVFVNPLQFGPGEDLDAYPRTLDADRALLSELGVTLVFAPTAAEMYPDGPSGTRVVAGEIGATLEGASRPGHFDGVLTVVTKLFSIVRPDAAVFGEKDRQQLFLVQRMVHDLNLGVEVHGLPTVRAADGLALSSRNRYLSDDERSVALAIPRALEAAASVAAPDASTTATAAAGVPEVRRAALAVLESANGLSLDYLAVVNPATFEPVDDDHRGDVVVLVAARVGSTRLIDNRAITL